jgi:hypothetical protein
MFRASKNFLLFLVIYFSTVGSCLKKWPITTINDLSAQEKKVVDWIKKYTVPNTLDKNGAAWTTKTLPKVNMIYDSSIEPAAYAAAIVTAWTISEGDYGVKDFYRVKEDSVCKWFEYPPQLPPQGDFPLQVFTYSNCQGWVETLDSDTGNYLRNDDWDCSCTGCDEGGRLIGPNQKCHELKIHEDDADWQNGIFAMEQSHVDSADEAANRAEKIYRRLRGKDITYVDVLDGTLTTAGFPQGTAVHETVMGCFPKDATGKRQRLSADDLTWACADMVSMWLTRNHLVAVTLALNDNPSFLLHKGNLGAVSVLAEYFSQ